MNILDKIVKEKENHNLYLKQKEKNIKYKYTKPNFYKSIKNIIDKKNNALIAEFKRFSPSVKKFKQINSIQDVINDYDKSKCCCISILTDKNFGGSLNDIYIAKKITSKPIIRKDFIINKLQVDESKNIGADAILLITKILTKKKIGELHDYAIKIGLDVLIEIENYDEIKKILDIDSKMIGINNRNLRKQRIDINNSIKLSAYLNNKIIVSESGITSSNIKKIKKNTKISSFLIGGSILNKKEKIRYINQLYRS